ncbi:MAG: mechanosensitive ion channel family protein [Myxococcales bacterium]|nr:mechanosensitive ion channel family protein [Myxococcales bacterium]
METDPSKLMEPVMEYGPKVVGVLVALLLALMIAGWAERVVRAGLERRNFDDTLTRFFAKLTRYLILIGAVLGCLGVFGIQTASFAAVLAAAGFAIGLAFQGTLGNFAAGVMLLVFRPFKVGDFVEVNGETGVCEHIDLFTCEFRTLDNRKLIIPNGSVFGSTITNYTGHEKRRVDIDVGAEYSADIDATRAALENAFAKVEGRLDDPPPQVFLKGLGDSSVDWQVRVWCRTEDYWDVWQSSVRATKLALDEAGVGIPFPQQDVHLGEAVVKALSN